MNAILGIMLVLLVHPGDPGLRDTLGHGTENRAVNILDSLLDLGRLESQSKAVKLSSHLEINVINIIIKLTLVSSIFCLSN